MATNCYWALPMAVIMSLAAYAAVCMGAPMSRSASPLGKSSFSNFVLQAPSSDDGKQSQELPLLFLNKVPQPSSSSYYDYAPAISALSGEQNNAEAELDSEPVHELVNTESDTEVNEVFRQLATGDEQAWNDYGDILLSAVDDMLANGEVNSVEEGVILLLHPEMSATDLRNLLTEIQALSNGAELVDDDAENGDEAPMDEGAELGDYESPHDYYGLAEEEQPIGIENDGQTDQSQKRTVTGKKGNSSRKIEASSATAQPEVSTSTTTAAPSNLQPAAIYDADDVLKSKRGQPEEPMFPGNHEDKSKTKK